MITMMLLLEALISDVEDQFAELDEIKGVMHYNTHKGFATYVQFGEDNLLRTSEGIRYKYGSLWYLITDETELVFA